MKKNKFKSKREDRTNSPFENKKKFCPFSQPGSPIIDYKDVISAINHMIKLNLEKDFNVSTGKKFYLKKIIIDLNSKIKKKKLTFIDTYKKSLIGNSNKLKKTGWKITKNFNYNKLIDY